MTKMFTYQGSKMSTWNPYSGCNFQCYHGCWAANLINTRLKDTPKYKDCGFAPTFHPNELRKKFHANDFVFVSSCGDLSFCKPPDLLQILSHISTFPQTKFLLCTKNPEFYLQDFPFPHNIYFGATIETNRDTSSISKAPPTIKRYEAMRKLNRGKKFLSIEPIMDFDLDIMCKWISDIAPKIVEVGADNYFNGLIEPSATKIQSLISFMEALGIEVVRKERLERLLK